MNSGKTGIVFLVPFLLIALVACQAVLPPATEPLTTPATTPPSKVVKTVYVTATPTPSPSPTPTLSPAPTPTAEPTPEPPKGRPAGTYIVGDDIEAGLYVLVADDEHNHAYLEVATDTSGEWEAILLNENFYNRLWVEVYDEEVFKVVLATIYRAEDAPPVPTGNLPGGMYKIGVDLPAGTYHLVVDDEIGSYYDIRIHARNRYQGIVNSLNFFYDTDVTVTEGQYLTVSRAFIEREE